MRDCACAIFHIEINLDVWIGPNKFRHGSLQGDGIVEVVRSISIMSERWKAVNEKTNRQGANHQRFVVFHFGEHALYRQESFSRRRQRQPDLRPPPTECLRDSFPREDSSAPCCINFFPPRRSRFPRKAFFSFFLVFFFLAIGANYSTRGNTSIRIPNS